MTLRVGLIGLGVMGAPMARNIAKAGLPLVVFNRSPGPARQLEGLGIEIAGAASEVFEKSNAVVLMLKDGEATDAVLGRSAAGLDVPVSGRVVVNAATLTPRYSEGLAAAIAGEGGAYIEAPVSGSRGPAERGELLLMTAGDPDAILRIRPILDAIGKKAIHCGAPPAAMRMKIASNLVLAGLMSGFTESVNFARKTGLDLDAYSEVLLGGPLANDALRLQLPRAIAEDYAPHASVSNVAYSMDVALDETARLGVGTDVARIMRGRCEKAFAMGFGEKDVLSVIKAIAAAGEKT